MLIIRHGWNYLPLRSAVVFSPYHNKNKNKNKNPHLNFLKGSVLEDKKQGVGIRDKGKGQGIRDNT